MSGAGARTARHLLAAFLGMGNWAALAQAGHSWPEALRAGVVQGTLSAAITLGLKRLVEGMAARLPGRWARLGPPLAAGGLSLGLLSTVHRLAGTPEILRTIVVPVAVSTSYAGWYAWTLARTGGRDADRAA